MEDMLLFKSPITVPNGDILYHETYAFLALE